MTIPRFGNARYFYFGLTLVFFALAILTMLRLWRLYRARRRTAA